MVAVTSSSKIAVSACEKNGSSCGSETQPNIIFVEKDSWFSGEDGGLSLGMLEWKQNGHVFKLLKMILLAINITNSELEKAKFLELQNQVDKLKTELEAKLKDKDSLEARPTEVENELTELNVMLEKLQKINNEQKNKVAKTERVIEITEEELMKVHSAWLPSWLAMQIIRCQAFIQTRWNVHGKPTMDMVIQKASKKRC